MTDQSAKEGRITVSSSSSPSPRSRGKFKVDGTPKERPSLSVPDAAVGQGSGPPRGSNLSLTGSSKKQSSVSHFACTIERQVAPSITTVFIFL